jgi:CheY-like chemotaxis protein
MNFPIKVLIAEDNLLNQKIIGILIQRLGWHYCIVDNGKKAVEECMKNEYDVVLMDIDMPVMNGWDATVAIKNHTPNLPVIAHTAYSEEVVKERSFAAGMDYFLAKPYNQMEIQRTILKSLQKED